MTNGSTDSHETDSSRPPADELFAAVYGELKKLAEARVRAEAEGQSLNATALVHEVFLRLQHAEHPFENPKHLLATASEAMRWILIDRARARRRAKRGGNAEQVELIESAIVAATTDEQLLAVEEVLLQLEAEDPESAELVKMHFYAGFTLKEISEATGVPYRTLKRKWAYARAWLKTALKKDL